MWVCMSDSDWLPTLSFFFAWICVLRLLYNLHCALLFHLCGIVSFINSRLLRVELSYVPDYAIRPGTILPHIHGIRIQSVIFTDIKSTIGFG